MLQAVAVLYFVCFLALNVAGIFLCWKDKSNFVFIVIDSLVGFWLAYFFLAFFFSDLATGNKWLAQVIFVAAVGWEIYDTPREIRRVTTDHDLSMQEKGLLLAVSTTFCIPAYIVGGLAVFR
ncbi:MAG: hypothetical protein SGI71_13010 [Verrucomicrobiota bacterium]|nr:hypothetical protein [Verrucomicrobiota bacterium]